MGILGAAGAADQWRAIEGEALRQALLKRESARQDEELQLRQAALAEERQWRENERDYRRQQAADAEMEAYLANAPLNGADRLGVDPKLAAWLEANPARKARYGAQQDQTLGSRQFGSAAEAAPPAQGGLAAPAAALGAAQYSAPQATGTVSINPMSRAEQAQRAAVAEATRRYEEGLKRTDRDFSADEAYRQAQLGISRDQVKNQALGIALQGRGLGLQEQQMKQGLEALAQRTSPGNAIALKGIEDEIQDLGQQLLTDARAQGQFGERFLETDPRNLRIQQLRQLQNAWIAENRASGKDPWYWTDLAAKLLQVQPPKRTSFAADIAAALEATKRQESPRQSAPPGAAIGIPR